MTLADALDSPVILSTETVAFMELLHFTSGVQGVRALASLELFLKNTLEYFLSTSITNHCSY